MARLIFISPYLKGGKQKAALSNRTHYIATREGVEKLITDQSTLKPTKNQEEFIRRLLQDFPEAKELGEFADYLDAPNRKTASEFIEQVSENYIRVQGQRENYLDYVAHRPGVRSDGDHGLWDANGKVPSLTKAMDEVANHAGNVWTPVVSIRREDAERLGYTDVDNWRALVCSCLPEIAKGYKIHPAHLRWYAALHEKEKHVHIHMILFSADPKEGYLTKQGIRDIKSAFATRIFRQDLLCIYERKTEYRNELRRSAAERMAELIRQISNGTVQNKRLEQLTAELAERLKRTGARRQYGYLPPVLKRIADEIVDELAKDERVASAYALWQEMQDVVCSTYSSTPPERFPLSAQKEFKSVRNMVVREAARLAELSFTLDDEEMDDEPEAATEPSPAWEAILLPGKTGRGIFEQADRYRRAKKTLYDTGADKSEKWKAVSTLEAMWDEGYILAAYLLGKLYRDGIGVPVDADQAIEWFQRGADAHNDYSEYALGKLLLERGDIAEGIGYLTRAAEHGNQYAPYRLGKLYLAGEQVKKNVDVAVEWFNKAASAGNQYAHYALGKLYLLGRDVPRDEERAIRHLQYAASQGNVYAQYFLNHRHEQSALRAGATVLRMLHHIGNIFQEQAATDRIYRGMQIDRKRRRELMDKRIALGHKPDDHEEQETNQQTI